MLRGQTGNDKMIGDSAVDGKGTAKGGGRDHFEGSSGKDLVIGDSYSRAGHATGGGDDGCAKSRSDPICRKNKAAGKRDTGEAHKPALNGGPSTDVMVGDSYTVTGLAEGSGNDDLKGLAGWQQDVRRQLRQEAAREGVWRGRRHAERRLRQ